MRTAAVAMRWLVRAVSSAGPPAASTRDQFMMAPRGLRMSWLMMPIRCSWNSECLRTSSSAHRRWVMSRLMPKKPNTWPSGSRSGPLVVSHTRTPSGPFCSSS
ncbi:hypothetical protein COSO111634_15200 [Corallococcus soli]